MTPPSRGYELMRKAALQLALTQEFTRRFTDPRQVIPYTYSDSLLTSYPHRDREFAGGVMAGAAAVNCKAGSGGFLLDYLGLGFTGLYFLERETRPAGISKLSRRLAAIDRHFSLLVISRGSQLPEPFTTIVDGEGRIFDAYAAKDTSFYLLRPDRHVAARWIAADADEIEEALSIALLRGKV